MLEPLSILIFFMSDSGGEVLALSDMAIVLQPTLASSSALRVVRRHSRSC